MFSDKTKRKSTVAIASSNDAELGYLRAPLDANLAYQQIDAIVKRAIELDTSPGSLRDIISKSDWVVIKPNIVTSRSHKNSQYWYKGIAHPGQVTDLRVIKSLIVYLIENCQPKRITIAEGGAEWRKNGEPGTDPDQTEDGWTVSWEEFNNLSYVDMVEEYNRKYSGLVDIVDLNYDNIHFVPVPDPNNSGISALQSIGETGRSAELFGRGAYIPGTGTLREGYHIPETILECDKLISVPAMKTHTICGTTLVMKNYIGILPSHPSGVVKKGNIHQGDTQKGFVDLFSYHPADYSIIEGFWSTEGNGPQWGDNLRHNVVIASSDPVAADAVGSYLMGFNPSDLDYLHYAARKGFGTFDLEDMEIIGNPIEKVKRKFKRGYGRRGISFAARGNRIWRVKGDMDESWRTFESQERYIDLARYFSNGIQSAVASVYVFSKRAQKGKLWAAADGKMTVELNGKNILIKNTEDGHRFAECKADVEIKEGLNTLSIQLNRSDKGFGFTAILCNDEGDGLYDIEYRTEEE
jgi:hypothetical protein